MSGSLTSSTAFVNNFLNDGAVKQSTDEIIRGGKYQDLRIPRRPKWDASMSGKEIA